jgi:hypothetical protein
LISVRLKPAVLSFLNGKLVCFGVKYEQTYSTF